MIRLYAISLLALFLSACASGGAQPPAPLPVSDLPDLERLIVYANSIDQLSRQLDEERQAQARPDCPKLCGLAHNICHLAEKICEIAERNPDHQRIETKCAEAQVSCKKARQQLAQDCHCRR